MQQPAIQTAAVPQMFVPAHYAAADPRSLIRRYPFGTLITTTPAGAYATSTPLIFETDELDCGALIGHIAGRNAHAVALSGGTAALALFLGPHAYVSPRWYKDKPQVPTWNYVAVQVRGQLEVLDSREQRHAVLSRTVEVMEAGSAAPWTMAEAPAGMVERLLDLIVAFRLTIEQIEGACKLNQSHPESDRLRVIRGLIDKGDVNELGLARLMAHSPPESP